MIKSFANRVTYFLIDNNSINIEDGEVCSYGFEILISSLINSIIVLSLGIILNKFIQTIIFIICYCSIRQFAGGYHANSHKKCIFTFLLMYLITIIFISNVNYIHIMSFMLILDILNWISIFVLVPIEHINNTLDNYDKYKNKKKARIRVTLILSIILIVRALNAQPEYILYSSLALFWVNFMLILQVAENNRGK